ncbi:MAG: EXLDI protein [Micromonosporaceae bacterium]
MPNKTIYVSDDDLPLYKRAQELVGGNLSAAISTALRKYIELEEGRLEGYDEITVRIGPGAGRKVRFSGILLGEWGRAKPSGLVEEFKVFRSRKDKYVVHTKRSDSWSSSGGWRGHLGLSETGWGMIKGEATLAVADSLDELRELIPDELYALVAALAEQPAVEDLDI